MGSGLTPLPSKIVDMIVGNTHHIVPCINKAGSKMIRHAKHITAGCVFAVLGLTSTVPKSTLKVPKKEISRL